ncbi:MAG: LLM class flavin-dependent oxidoreductase [Proteobacteria bacterium]|nr:LLM class flavin-dependent oxidoreductase [Pseudomonadota bacterium]MDA1136041.1 LLM class flavin-dependent oxidoreductase [Pseudomonadota bacterium]
MDIGFFTMPIHPIDKDYKKTLKEDREAFLLADKLGFSEAYCGEHVTDSAENITSSILFIASLAAETKNIRLGTGTVNMPNSHPAAIAGQIAMLDHMLDGRFNFGISPGGLASDAEVFGNLEKDRNEMFVECIDIVLEIWKRDAPYNIKGKYWEISTEKTQMTDIGQGIMQKPFQQPHPPIICTVVAPFSKGLIAAAARGWHPISANFLLPKWVKTHWPSYVEGCNKGGIKPLSKNWRIAKSIFVCEDRNKAKEYALGNGSPYVFYYKQLLTKMLKHGRANLFKEDQSIPDNELKLDEICNKLIIYGSADEVSEKLLQFREKVGDFGTLLYAGHDWKDVDLAKKSMELMSDKVMPQINQNIQLATE